MKDKSIQRLESMTPLSRDHGTALVCAHHGRKAVRASEHDRLRLAEQMRSIYRDEIDPNLEDEQWILSPLIGDAGLREEFHQRHRTIRELSTRLSCVEMSEDPGLGLIARLANVLDDYVRWEENTLYPRIVDGIEKDKLEHLSRLTSKLETGRNRPTQRLHRSVTLEQPSGLLLEI
ncbi:MAG: hypothetical protein K8F91_14115 [Candidatus Obscuribacterales bacterium]|nr:hypothetical protein [Candidatus Obscuribacterales bacterium]